MPPSSALDRRCPECAGRVTLDSLYERVGYGGGPLVRYCTAFACHWYEIIAVVETRPL